MRQIGNGSIEPSFSLPQLVCTSDPLSALPDDRFESLGRDGLPSSGHSRRKWAVRAMFGLPPMATELRTSLAVRFVPSTDMTLIDDVLSG